LAIQKHKVSVPVRWKSNKIIYTNIKTKMSAEEIKNLSLGKFSFSFWLQLFQLYDKNLLMQLADAIFTSEKYGNDEIGDGSEKSPFKTILRAMHHVGKEPFPTIYVDSKDESSESKFEPAAKSQLKKIQKLFVREGHKNAAKNEREAESALKRTQNLDEAKKITISEDPSLPAAKKVRIFEGVNHRNDRVKIYGWVHRLRVQGKGLMFITLRDGTGFLQCVLTDVLCQTYEALTLTTESSVVLFGKLLPTPEGKTVSYYLNIFQFEC